MRRVLLLFAVLPVLLYACVSTSPTTVQQAAMEETTEKLEDPKLPIDSLVTVGQLDNGLRYVIRQNQKPETESNCGWLSMPARCWRTKTNRGWRTLPSTWPSMAPKTSPSRS